MVSISSGRSGLARSCGDVLVDRARAARELDAPDALEQGVAAEQQAGMLHEVSEQLELGGRQVDGPAGDHLVPRPRQGDVADAAIGLLIGLSGAPQHGLHASGQLARAERLGHVVVGAELEAGDAVGLVVARGQHDHRQARAGADAAADLEAVDAGQADVEHDQGDLVARQLGKPLFAGAHRDDAMPVALECDADEIGDVPLVLDDQYRRHPGLPSTPPCYQQGRVSTRPVGGSSEVCQRCVKAARPRPLRSPAARGTRSTSARRAPAAVTASASAKRRGQAR